MTTQTEAFHKMNEAVHKAWNDHDERKKQIMLEHGNRPWYCPRYVWDEFLGHRDARVWLILFSYQCERLDVQKAYDEYDAFKATING